MPSTCIFCCCRSDFYAEIPYQLLARKCWRESGCGGVSVACQLRILFSLLKDEVTSKNNDRNKRRKCNDSTSNGLCYALLLPRNEKIVTDEDGEEIEMEPQSGARRTNGRGS